MDAQINDNGEIPLVNVNDGSGDAEENHEKKAARDRKESRFISTVSMNSGSEDDGEYGKVSTTTLSYNLILRIPKCSNL